MFKPTDSKIRSMFVLLVLLWLLVALLYVAFPYAVLDVRTTAPAYISSPTINMYIGCPEGYTCVGGNADVISCIASWKTSETSCDVK